VRGREPQQKKRLAENDEMNRGGGWVRERAFLDDGRQLKNKSAARGKTGAACERTCWPAFRSIIFQKSSQHARLLTRL
jgi:hypothetical protein